MDDWITTRNRESIPVLTLPRSLCLLFLGGQQTVSTSESEHHPTELCQDFLRPSSCEGYSVTIIRQGVNLFKAWELHVFTMGAQDKMSIIWRLHIALTPVIANILVWKLNWTIIIDSVAKKQQFWSSVKCVSVLFCRDSEPALACRVS